MQLFGSRLHVIFLNAVQQLKHELFKAYTHVSPVKAAAAGDEFMTVQGPSDAGLGEGQRNEEMGTMSCWEDAPEVLAKVGSQLLRKQVRRGRCFNTGGVNSACGSPVSGAILGLQKGVWKKLFLFQI